MPVNECSFYRQSKPFPSILSREQEEVAFRVLNCLRASAQSSLRNSHRILNYCYQAFPHPTGAQVSFLTNAFSSQESRGCSACPWGAAITFCRARGSSTRHLQMQQSLPHLHGLQTKWSRQAPLHCRMSPKESWGIPRELSAPLVCSVWRDRLGFLPVTLRKSLCLWSADFRLTASNFLWKCFRTNHAFNFVED